jgi:hypothetical protein
MTDSVRDDPAKPENRKRPVAAWRLEQLREEMEFDAIRSDPRFIAAEARLRRYM